jgi:hypothetical protein
MRSVATRRAAILPVRPAALVAAWLFIPGLAAGYSGGPPDGFCGNPPNFFTCAVCHGEGQQGNGSLLLQNVPAQYEPNQSYDLVIELGDPDQVRWGFEITVMNDATLEMAGTIEVTNATTTQLSDNPDNEADFLKHTLAGTFNGFPNGPVTWGFRWTAPASGNVTFYLAGNAANGSGSADGGDVIYAIQVPLIPTTGIDPGEVPAAITALEPSFPNPFRPATTIPFTLSEPGRVVLSVYGTDGKLVTRLLDDDRAAGHHQVTWNGRDMQGRRAPSGVYFLSLAAPRTEARQRVVLTN